MERKHVTKYEESKILPCLQANRSTCHHFIETSRGHETPVTEMKDSLLFMAIAVARVPAIFISSLSLRSYRAAQRGPDVNRTYSGLCDRRGTLSLRNLNLLWWAVSMPTLCSRGRHYISHGYLLYKHPWRESPEQNAAGASLARYAKMWENHKELSSSMCFTVELISVVNLGGEIEVF